MNYEQAMAYIIDSYQYGSKYGLERMRKLMSLLGDPQEALSFVHVAGTNGKGSTVAFTSHILIDAGYKVGIFTSPYLQRFGERIKVNHNEIPDNALAGITALVKEKIDLMLKMGYENPTFFELFTAIAFLHFYQEKCDIVVLEVGMGGILDSTNIISKSLVSVITAIDVDHVEYLGNTLAEIAKNKAGIIKPAGSVVVYPQKEEVLQVIRKTCTDQEARLFVLEESNVQHIRGDFMRQVFDYKKYHNLEIGILGTYQCNNASMAIETVLLLNQSGYVIQESNIRRGLAATRWPGRMEILDRNPILMIDVAHNVHGTKALHQNLLRLFPGRKFVFMVGVLADKDYAAMLAPFIPLAKQFITVTPDSFRALPGEELSRFLSGQGANTVIAEDAVDALDKAYEIAAGDDVICAFGSLYFIGLVRNQFQENSRKGEVVEFTRCDGEYMRLLP